MRRAARGVRRSAIALVVGTLGLLAATVVGPPQATAATTAEIRRQAQEIVAERDALQRRGALDTAAEQRLVEGLGGLVLSFIDQSDQAARAGTENAGALRPAFEAVYDPLNGTYSRRSTRLDRLARAIMDADGDLEALYETADWKESQLVAAQSLYYLNWLNYYGARLYEGARKKELLEAAEKGFSEFAIGDRKTALLTESLLGRALCHLELGNYDWAIRDFRLVVEEPSVSAERKAKARLGLVETYVRAGRTTDALGYSQQLLQGALSPDDVPSVRYLRLQALFDAVKKAAPADAERYRRETVTLMGQLRRAGKGWSERVDALMMSSIEDPSQWAGKAETPYAKWQLATMLLQRGNDTAAVPLLEDLLASEDAEAKQHHAEASYLLGVARFKLGDYAGAVGSLDAALAGEGLEHSADAMYLRFKALEGLMADEPTEALGQRYEAAMLALLAAHPEHASAHEARYRLGEYLQARGDFAGAVEEYARVTGDAGLEVRGAFGALQCELELLKAARGRDAREQSLARIERLIEDFWARSAAFEKQKSHGDVPLEQFQATVTVFGAVVWTLREGEHDAEIAQSLAGFEERFPSQTDLFAQVVRLRLGALQRLGNFAEASRVVGESGAVIIQDGRADLVESLAVGFAKAGARRKAEGDQEAARAAEVVAVRLLELLPAETGAAKTRLSLAKLYESTGDLERAEAAYADILQANSNSLAALRGLARTAEARQDLGLALTYWRRYSDTVRPGDHPWYEGQYQQARLLLARGDQDASCAFLEKLRPAMPGLGDADLRGRLGELYKQACG